MKHAYRAGLPLVMASIPATCMAEAGEAAGAIDAVLTIAKYELGWTLLSIIVFLLLRLCKISNNKRVALSFLFWISQLYLPELAFKLYGEAGTHVAEQVTKPVVLAGVTFPAGSQADYVRLGGGFWRRKLVEVTSASPVKLGSWEITHLNLKEPYGDIAYAWLVRPETIDEWPCGKWAGFELGAARPRLYSCELVRPRSIGDLVWPPGTFVDRAPDDGWAPRWDGGGWAQGHRRVSQAFGFAVDSMSATYNASLELQTLTSDLANADFEVGDYKFFKGDTNVLSWQSPGELRIHGYAKNAKTGAEIRCVRVTMPDRTTRPCDDEGEDRHRDPSNEASGDG